MASDGGHEASEGQLVDAGLLDGEYPCLPVHPLCGDCAASVENFVFSEVRVRLVAGE